MTKINISVSVAMATYNGQKNIGRQLESLAAQSLRPTEIIVSDDNSQDDTVAIVNDFSKTAQFTVSIHRNKTTLGYRANFMRAANLCQSDLIAFCDQDDYWYPHKIAVATEPFSDPEVLLTYHNADIVAKDGRLIGSLFSRSTQQSNSPAMSTDPWRYAPGFTEIFRRTLLTMSDSWYDSRECFERDQPCSHDRWFFFLASVFGRIIYLDEPLASYLQHANNTYGWTAPQFRELQSYFRDRADESARFAAAAESRAIALEKARNRLDGTWHERATVAAERYRKLSRLFSERNSLYTSADIGDRFRAFRGLLANGGYMNEWTLGRKSLFTDILLGVPIGHLLQSRSRTL